MEHWMVWKEKHLAREEAWVRSKWWAVWLMHLRSVKKKNFFLIIWKEKKKKNPGSAPDFITSELPIPHHPGSMISYQPPLLPRHSRYYLFQCFGFHLGPFLFTPTDAILVLILRESPLGSHTSPSTHNPSRAREGEGRQVKRKEKNCPSLPSCHCPQV